jgi:uncharacterized protein YbaA (DUF1428 family)
LIFIVHTIRIAMENKNESSTEIQEGTGNYLGLNFVRAPKKNHDAMEQIGKPFAQWFKKHGVRTEIFHLSSNSSTTTSEQEVPEGVESIAKTLSIKDDEEIWVMLQFYRDQAHAQEITAMMMTMQDESIGKLVKEFDGLVTQGSSLIMGGFSRLKV